jgi:hypothetical protein
MDQKKNAYEKTRISGCFEYSRMERFKFL